MLREVLILKQRSTALMTAIAVLILAGCTSPTPRHSEDDSTLLPSGVGSVNITFAHPRNVYTETYEYRFSAVAPDGQTFDGTIYQRSGPDCLAPDCVVREEGRTGDFVQGTEANGSPYDYLRTSGVAYVGNWTLRIEELAYRQHVPTESGFQCAQIRFAEPDKTPDDSDTSWLGYDGRTDCLSPGVYRVAYDGRHGTLLSGPD